MSDPYLLCEPELAAAYLGGFPPETKKAGDALFGRSKVSEPSVKSPGSAYVVKVADGDDYEVALVYTPDEGWRADCECARDRCPHVYAAWKVLLAEDSAAKVRNLSAGRAPARPEKVELTLGERLARALGRPLRPQETRYINAVRALHQECRKPGLNTWDFRMHGFEIASETIALLFNHCPRDENEFWVLLAAAAIKDDQPLPPFMAPVTDMEQIHRRLAEREREQAIAHWKAEFILEAKRSERSSPSASAESVDLRLKFEPGRIVLEWKAPGRAEFERIPASDYLLLDGKLEEHRLGLPPEAESLWDALNDDLTPDLTDLTVTDSEGLRRKLNRLIRFPWLATRLVNPEGKPFLHAASPLRWELIPPEGAAGERDGKGEDYRLQLVCSDGSPMPPVLCKLEGNPALYVTATTLFPAPLKDCRWARSAVEFALPAPAVESAEGVSFIKEFDLPVPPKIRDRIETVPMTVKIFCSLEEKQGLSAREVCTFKVIAQSADGLREEFWRSDAGWFAVRSLVPGNRKDQPILLYDRSTLLQLEPLMAGLGLVPSLERQSHLFTTRRFPETFVAWLKSLPPEVEVSLKGELASLAQAPVSGKVQFDLTEREVDWFDLKVVLNASDTDLTPDELDLLLASRGRWVRLGKKGWRRLELNFSERDEQRLADLGLEPLSLDSEPQRVHSLQLADDAAAALLSAEQFALVKKRAHEIKTSVTPEPPANVQATLRPYQKEGFHFLAYLSANRFGGILADDMGLGKTVQALTWLAWLRTDPENRSKPILVVCPKSVMGNWRAETERFTPDLRLKVWAAHELPEIGRRLQEADLHVINYSQLRLAGESLSPIIWLAAILDEGQYIKNPSSQTAQIARALHAQHRLVLSGTPIENRLLDLWSLMTFAMPGLLGSRAHFGQRYSDKNNSLARRRLAARVRPFLLRRTKIQVANDLPDRIEEDLLCELEGEQLSLYRAQLKFAQQLLLKIKTQKQLAREQFHFLAALLRLRQICCHPALMKADSTAESAKVTALMDLLEPLMDEGHKVLIFSQFVAFLDLLRPQLESRSWPLFYLSGKTEDRDSVVSGFQSTPGPALFLISLKAGGFGLNLTAASYVVLLDPWWNPAVENQAIDRSHRIGQANKVIAYRLLIKDSIEEKIRGLQQSKSALAQDVIGEKFEQNLSLEDFQFLFSEAG